MSGNGADRTLAVVNLGIVDYPEALALQEALAAARQEERVGDTLLLLEHPHVYTLGRGADQRFIRFVPPSVPVYRVSRGGQVTYHGPGQLVGYPILALKGKERDVHRYLRRLEQAMIEPLGRCGIEARRRRGLTGVWVGQRKIASIGVGLRRWTTLHGFALNVCPDLRYFEAIVPCGIEDCVMTSIAAEGHAEVTMESFAALEAAAFADALGYEEIELKERSELEGLGDWRAVSHCGRLL